MKRMRIFVGSVAIAVLAICVYSFLLGNKVFEKRFENDYIAWYFLAKGMFCALSLWLGVCALERLSARKGE